MGREKFHFSSFHTFLSGDSVNPKGYDSRSTTYMTRPCLNRRPSSSRGISGGGDGGKDRMCCLMNRFRKIPGPRTYGHFSCIQVGVVPPVLKAREEFQTRKMSATSDYCARTLVAHALSFTHVPSIPACHLSSSSASITVQLLLLKGSKLFLHFCVHGLAGQPESYRSA